MPSYKWLLFCEHFALTYPNGSTIGSGITFKSKDRPNTNRGETKTPADLFGSAPVQRVEAEHGVEQEDEVVRGRSEDRLERNGGFRFEFDVVGQVDGMLRAIRFYFVQSVVRQLVIK